MLMPGGWPGGGGGRTGALLELTDALALRNAAAAVSQVDLLYVTPLKNCMTPCLKKINWNTVV